MLHFLIGFILGGICGVVLYKLYRIIKTAYLGVKPTLNESRKDLDQAFNALNQMTKDLDKMNRDMNNYGRGKNPPRFPQR